ncbi:MAG: hypothetical protein CFH39_01818, partial [Alphaproteobacteria bacterium MarineAlpha10_Bin2]
MRAIFTPSILLLLAAIAVAVPIRLVQAEDEADYAVRRAAMVRVIEQHVVATADHVGRDSFDPRVLA